MMTMMIWGWNWQQQRKKLSEFISEFTIISSDWSAQIQFFAVLMRHKISWEICETLCHKFAKLNFAEHWIVFFISLSASLFIIFFVDSYFELKLMQSDLKDYWLPYSCCCCCHCRSLKALFIYEIFNLIWCARGGQLLSKKYIPWHT